uniref:Sodium/calcium exchanger membrane region domain-containing protein n=1 Tax=Mycena chlorophos TaxID=658473 RepID=A0ABQ0LQI8_MYCCL|nr:predicted protein [Mycena chlorophos]
MRGKEVPDIDLIGSLGSAAQTGPVFAESPPQSINKPPRKPRKTPSAVLYNMASSSSRLSGVADSVALTQIATNTSVQTSRSDNSRQPIRKRSTAKLDNAEEGRNRLQIDPPARRPTVGSSTRTNNGQRSGWQAILAAIRTIDWKHPFPGRPGLPPAPSVAQSIRNVVFHSWFNVLLVFIPVAIALHFAVPDQYGAIFAKLETNTDSHQIALHFAVPNQYGAIFATCFVAIIPLAQLLSFATEDISLRVGQALAGLLNATLALGKRVRILVLISSERPRLIRETCAYSRPHFLRATAANPVRLLGRVELIVAIIALIHCELDIVQASLLTIFVLRCAVIGSILGNLLLVLGMCFFLGGMKFSEQGFNMDAAQLNSSLLALTVVTVVFPLVYKFSAQVNGATDAQIESQILSLSHGMAVVLLIVYAGYLAFTLVSHTALYDDENPNALPSTPAQLNGATDAQIESQILSLSHGMAVVLLVVYAGYLAFTLVSHTALYDDENPNALPSTPYGKPPSPAPIPLHVLPPTPLTPSSARPLFTEEPQSEDPAEGVPGNDASDPDLEAPQLHMSVCFGLLVAVTVLVAFIAEYFVDSISGLTASGKITTAFVGIVLLPIAGNIAEHVSAVTSSWKDKLTMGLGIAVGSSVQIGLFVLPFIVVVGWGLGKPMSFLVDPLQAASLFLAVLTVNYASADGKSNWMEGLIMLALYSMIGTLFFFYHEAPPQTGLMACN